MVIPYGFKSHRPHQGETRSMSGFLHVLKYEIAHCMTHINFIRVMNLAKFSLYIEQFTNKSISLTIVC
jgi:hypothetical protein